jgi:hypothetical protein
MNSTTQTLLRSVLKIGAGYFASKGIADQNTLHVIYAGAVALIGVIWGLVHRNSSSNASSGAGVSRYSLMLLMAVSVLALGTAGCQTSPSKSHVIRAVATGTKAGITQNPTTGVYEFGLQRVQTEIITVPVFFTNGVWYAPDVVSRYEVNTHSAVFGNANLTSSLATGSNAVNTAVGGTTPPINSNTGTSNMLTPLSH